MKQAILVAILWVASGVGAVAQPPVYQLRIYKLHPGNEAHFHDRFRDQCIPIMKRYGFDIVFTSQSSASGHEEFVYLLRWKDRAMQVQAWKKSRTVRWICFLTRQRRRGCPRNRGWSRPSGLRSANIQNAASAAEVKPD